MKTMVQKPPNNDLYSTVIFLFRYITCFYFDISGHYIVTDKPEAS